MKKKVACSQDPMQESLVLENSESCYGTAKKDEDDSSDISLGSSMAEKLSSPPWFSLYLNPSLSEVIGNWSKDSPESEVKLAYAGDFRVRNRHPVYQYHPYHTKVPPDVIRTLIEHYTAPNAVVLDPFAGSGMTGVAARESSRRVVLVDLSPISTFISAVNCETHDAKKTTSFVRSILAESEAMYGHLYQTVETGNSSTVAYYVRTDCFTCPNCQHEFPFFPYGVVHHGNKVETKKAFPCPSCLAELNVRRVERVIKRDGKKSSLCWVHGGKGALKINRPPNHHDLDLENQVNIMGILDWYPTDPVDPGGYTAKLAQLGNKNISDVSRFLSKRNLIIFADLWNRAMKAGTVSEQRAALSILTSVFTVVSERQGYFGGGGGMSGNLYMPIVRMEKNPYECIRRKLRKFSAAEAAKPRNSGSVLISTQSATDLSGIPSESIDYIYADPPFGANIIYSEMNLVLEAWLQVRMDPSQEAVIDETRGRGFSEYASLMKDSFRECYRVLKPGSWITVEFHNTKAAVWNLIQTAISEAGFAVSQVGVLDKGSTTILNDIRPGAATYDLLISAYKPIHSSLHSLDISTSGSVWSFITDFLGHVRVWSIKGDALDLIKERTSRMLFDKYVAYQMHSGLSIPLSAQEFYSELHMRYPERDGMYFLPEQVAEYDKKRSGISELRQLSLFIYDEESSILWLRKELLAKPKTFHEIQPDFLKEIQTWAKHEQTIELVNILEENFIKYECGEPVPSQIHSYLSSNHKHLRNRDKLDAELMAEAQDRWYVPDPSKQIDLEKLRERILLREFQQYKESKKKKLKVFRTEAIRAGFKVAYDSRDFDVIIRVSEMLPENVLQEDEKLLMYYDVALTLTDAR